MTANRNHHLNGRPPTRRNIVNNNKTIEIVFLNYTILVYL